MLPELPELPEIVDAGTSGLRLHSTAVKALPAMPDGTSGTKARQMEAEQYADEMRAAFDLTRRQNKRSQAIARAKNRQQEEAAKRFGKR